MQQACLQVCECVGVNERQPSQGQTPSSIAAVTFVPVRRVVRRNGFTLAPVAGVVLFVCVTCVLPVVCLHMMAQMHRGVKLGGPSGVAAAK